MTFVLSVDDVEVPIDEMGKKEFTEEICLQTGDLVTLMSEGDRKRECLYVVRLKKGDREEKEMAIFDYTIWFDLSRRSRSDMAEGRWNVQMVIDGYVSRRYGKGYASICLKLSQDDFEREKK